MNISLFKVLVAFILGVGVSKYVNTSPIHLLSICILIFCLLLLLHSTASKKTIAAFVFGIAYPVLFLVLGIFISLVQQPKNISNHYENHLSPKKQLLVFSVQENLKPTTYDDKYVINIHTLSNFSVTGKALLNVQKDSCSSQLELGRWYVTNQGLQELPKPRYPYQFNYGNYLRKKHIYRQIRTPSDALLPYPKQSYSIGILGKRFRESIITKLRSYSFTPNQLAIIKALVLGERSDINGTIQSQYAAAGLMHILAVSGLHVGILLLLLRFLLSIFKNKRLKIYKTILILLGIWSFAIITGASPSVLRAATMFTFIQLGTLRAQSGHTIDGVLFSALLLLLIEPNFLFQVGFQLSYLAVISILYIQPLLYKLYRPRFYLDKLYWGVATVTIAAQLGVAPLSIYYFNQFPGLFMISNLVVLPSLGIILGLGILVIILALVDQLPTFLISSYGYIIDLLNNYIAWVARQEAFVFTQLKLSTALLLLVYLVLGLGVYYFKKRTQNKLILFLIGVLFITGYMHWKKRQPLPHHFTIYQKSRSSLMTHYQNGILIYQTTDTLFMANTDSRLIALQNALPIKSLKEKQVNTAYHFNEKQILYLNTKAYLPLPIDYKPDYIILANSPDINLARLIMEHPDIIVIADGSNYKSDIDQWSATCRILGIPFHSTYSQGAYIIE